MRGEIACRRADIGLLMGKMTPWPAALVADQGTPPVRVCFFFNAQRHQLLHGISTAVELARMPGFDVYVSSPNEGHIDYARRLVALLGGAPIRFEVLSPPLLTFFRKRSGRSVPPKLLGLAAVAHHLNGFDAIAVPERTTVQLKRVGVRGPLYIHLDHGAGDRAAGFDRRIRHFDMVLMAGEKHRERLGREGLIHEGGHAVVGYPKFDAADAIRDAAWDPFGNGRPTVLYNPHFCTLGSWAKFGVPLLEAFARQHRYNLIVAPHVRMLDSRAKRARWQALTQHFAGARHLLLDPGSDRAIDMSYTSFADIYVGDVSSQVYEFLRTPKPCLFLDAQGIDWQNDENYGHWRFGPVEHSAADLVGAVDAAVASHGAYRAAQLEGFNATFSADALSPSERAAEAIGDFLHMRLRGGAVARPAVRRLQRAAAVALMLGAGSAEQGAMTARAADGSAVHAEPDQGVA